MSLRSQKMSIDYKKDSFIPLISLNGIKRCLKDNANWEVDCPEDSKRPITLKAQCDSVSFEATSDSVQSNYLNKYYIGVIEGTELKIHDSCLFSMNICQSSPTELPTCSKDDLLEQFGSKKLQKMNQKLTQQLQTQSVVDEMTLLSHVVDKPISECSDMIPWNREATCPAELYPINSIISARDLSCIHQSITWIQNMESDCPRTIARALKKTPLESVSSEWRRSLQYLLHLMSLYTSSNRQINEFGFFYSGPPARINEVILSEYVVVDETGRYGIPQRLRTRLLCHIIILALTAHGFNMKVKYLVKDLGLNMGVLVTCCKGLGCLVVKKTKNMKDKSKIVLPFPPKFPAPSKGFRRKNKN